MLAEEPTREWCLKFPTGCGASGHRRLVPGMALPKGWPLPLLVQEFIRLDRPEVYRTYAAGGELFGWVVRRFPDGITPSPWVAHARGARYAVAGEASVTALAAARLALEATGLLGAFGCVDLLRRPSGEWIVLEVGTDGMFNHVDRDLGCRSWSRSCSGGSRRCSGRGLAGGVRGVPAGGAPDKWLRRISRRSRLSARCACRVGELHDRLGWGNRITRFRG